MNGIKSINNDDIIFPVEKEKLILKKLKIKFALLLLISNSILYLVLQPQKAMTTKDSLLNLTSEQNVIINMTLINHSPFLDNAKNNVTIYSKDRNILVNQATLIKVLNNNEKYSALGAKTYLVEMHKKHVANIINQKNDFYFLAYPKDSSRPVSPPKKNTKNKRKKSYEIIF